MNEEMKAVIAKYKERAKEEGFGELELFAKKATNLLFDFTADFIKATPTMIDDFALLVLPKVKEFILKMVDKIDGDTN